MARWWRRGLPRSCSRARRATIPAPCSPPPSSLKPRRRAWWRSRRPARCGRGGPVHQSAMATILLAINGWDQKGWEQRVRGRYEPFQPAASDVVVCIMGLGVLGSSAAFMLHRIGFKIIGWSRTRKALPGIETFYGEFGLDPFLRRTEILVCLLPATP